MSSRSPILDVHISILKDMADGTPMVRGKGLFAKAQIGREEKIAVVSTTTAAVFAKYGLVESKGWEDNSFLGKEEGEILVISEKGKKLLANHIQ